MNEIYRNAILVACIIFGLFISNFIFVGERAKYKHRYEDLLDPMDESMEDLLDLTYLSIGHSIDMKFSTNQGFFGGRNTSILFEIDPLGIGRRFDCSYYEGSCYTSFYYKYFAFSIDAIVREDVFKNCPECGVFPTYEEAEKYLIKTVENMFKGNFEFSEYYKEHYTEKEGTFFSTATLTTPKNQYTLRIFVFETHGDKKEYLDGHFQMYVLCVRKR